MIALSIVLLTLAIGLFSIGIHRYNAYYEGEICIGTGIAIGLLTLIVMPILIFKWHLGSDQYTGYIYSTSTAFGYTTAHIRFSENAGTDSQPSVCLSGEEAEKAIALAGTGTKVKITLTSKGFFVADNPFECSADATIEEMEE